MLKLENVSKSFGALKAVDQVSFELSMEGISGLIGPNGSGKTTLLDLISGFLNPGNGHIDIDETPILSLSKKEISKKISSISK